ncbi:MAG: type II toxin-antitoxin system HicB family antitoxin [Bacteroidales bacterium]|nr:type II toxin-antitoxin system HicB family antitoxin [Bacteroidales bacterium]
MMKKNLYNVVIKSAIEGGFTAYIPQLPGCISEGETFGETMKNICEAAELWLEVNQEQRGQNVKGV